MAPLPRFIVLYGLTFAAFGAASPFLPGLLEQDGLQPGAIGAVLASGTAVRLLTGPAGARLADRSGRAPLVLAGFTAASAVLAMGYATARGLPMLLLVSVAHAAVLAPLTPVADALALGSSRRPPPFEYGWVRGAGSAAFIAGILVSGQLVGWLGNGVIIWQNAGLLLAAAGTAWLVPNQMAGLPARDDAPVSMMALLRIPGFLRLMSVAALIGGSHALHDGFEVIRWRAAGLSAGNAGVLWALSVAGEIGVFVFAGRRLLDRFGPARCLMLSAAAGILRWAAAAQTAWFPVMAVIEPLHGLTFALMHLACIERIGQAVPRTLAATAQAFYATVAIGAASACFTLASGPLYQWIGADSFWLMAALCAAALPLAYGVGSLPHKPDVPTSSEWPSGSRK